jgi:hypothetical protein
MLELTRKKYAETIEYHNSIGYDPKLNVIWRDNMPDIAKIFDQSKTAEELIDRVDQTFMYSINFPPENGQNTGVWRSPGDIPHIREKCVDWLLSRQKSIGVDLFSMPEHVQESEFIHSRNKVTRNGRTVSGNFLRTLSCSWQIFKHVGRVKNVIELGGGCGHQARTWMLQVPDAKYTIVDLPETLIFSFTHLSLSFPNKKLLWVTSEEDVAKIDDYDIVFVPAVFAPFLHGRNYDLFINTASMGEMRNETIHKWMDFIQNKIVVNNLFTLNRFLNTVDSGHATFRANENECSTSYDHKWEIINWELEPIYCRCPYIDTLHSRYLEIIAKRPAPENEKSSAEVSKYWLMEAQSEDWFRLNGYYGNGIMQARNNVLVNDTTMSGPLFKLWESIRLDQNVENISTMLYYLDRITVGCNHIFEEKMYYESLLNRLKS